MAPLERGSIIQRGVLTASVLLLGVGLYWISRSFVVEGQLRFGNPVEAGPMLGAETSDPQPRQVRAEVTRVTGNAVVREGDKCEFLVERRLRDQDSFYCNAQVVCGGRLLYGGPDRGFFACKLSEQERRDVVGSDPNTTGADRDGAIHLNTIEGVMRIWDDEQGPLGAFAVEAEILSVH
jgi:hypothetical protein